MSKGKITTLFVSSTCYDLSQIRSDIKDFSESLGLEPILSELDSFPINPSQSNIENCLEAVRSHADIFLLIVGGRYGSMNDAGISITNLEYLEATAKKIPKFVFVRREILSYLNIWRTNPTADFSSVVDTSKLFEFVSALRDGGDVWVFPFDNVADIKNALRKQLSALFSESLELRAKLQLIDPSILALGAEALRIYIERPMGWEYLFFAKILQNQIDSYHDKWLDLELGISFGPVIDLQDRLMAVNWIQKKFTQIQQIVEGMSKSVNNGVSIALGKPGEPGDVQRIRHAASRIAYGYLQALEWTLEFYRVDTIPDFEKLMQLTSHFSSNIISETKKYSQELYDKLKFKIENHTPGETANFTLTFTVPPHEAYSAELERVMKLAKQGKS